MVARALEKSYGERRAVDGIDFEVPAGICFGFLGPNGAGKTTTMKMIYGLAAIGRRASCGCSDMDAVRERRRIKARIGVVPQETNLDGELTVRENLVVHGELLRSAARERRRTGWRSCSTSPCSATGPARASGRSRAG